jgi:hypothetical protein
MNETTPPKLIPPFHRTAANGTLPIEQTKLRTDDRSPDLRTERVVGEEQVLPEGLGHPGAHRAGDQQTDRDVPDHGSPLHDEDVADRRVTARGTQPGPDRAGVLDAHVHRGVAFHGPGQAAVSLLGCLSDEAGTQQCTKEQRQDDDHHRAADELGRGELPAENQGQDDPEFDDQIGAADLECHRGREVRTLAKQRAGQCHRGVRAGRARRAQTGGDCERLGSVVAEQSSDGLSANQRLHHGRECEAEDEGPEDFPRHRAGQLKGVSQSVQDIGHGIGCIPPPPICQLR